MPCGAATAILGTSRSRRINTLVCDIISHSWAVRTGDGVKNPPIGMSRRVLKATNLLRDFLFQNIYVPLSRQKETEDARIIVRRLYEYHVFHADKLPLEYKLSDDSTERRVVDYIAGIPNR
jgi:dGTPase